ncbi:MAG: hypothetical protein AB7L91_18160 [Dehalococcoidia bacterium]
MLASATRASGRAIPRRGLRGSGAAFMFENLEHVVQLLGDAHGEVGVPRVELFDRSLTQRSCAASAVTSAPGQ